MDKNPSIEIYMSADKKAQLQVRFEEETVWLTQQQMSLLFGQTKQNISLHINNCFKEKELSRNSTVKDSLTVHIEGDREVRRKVTYYNLDVIISVGYRVKSKRGVQFRQWATARLKEYLVEGYSINKRRLDERNLEIQHLKDGIRILRRTLETHEFETAETDNLTALLDEFAQGLSLLDDFDHETLDHSGKTRTHAAIIKSDEYRSIIASMRSDFPSGSFGIEKDDSFESSTAQIYQSLGGSDLYPSLEEKAAMLLYFIVKNHSFLDGNKRIAAACFLFFMEKNGMLHGADGKPVLDGDTLAALTLFLAMSKPEEMETVKRVVISILNRFMRT